MLTVAKVTQGQADDYAEYLEAKSEPDQLGDYYLRDGDRVQAPGRWVAGAGIVGCDPERPVEGSALRTLMQVRRPDDGQPLRRVGASGTAVAAIDATFSAPKSVSVVWALAPPSLRERIEHAHERAIDAALRYSLRWVRMVRERVDRKTVIHVRAQRMIATSWRHTTARSVGGQPPDPQLHSHVLLHGAVRRDGRVVAIDSRSWLVHRREVGAAYRTELARGLGELGFGIRRGTGRAGRYFEVAGVPGTLIEQWSSRHHQVRKAIDARLADRQLALQAVVAGGGDAAARARRELGELESALQLAPRLDRFLTTATRAAKDGVRTGRELDRYWQRAARSHRFGGREIQRLRGGGRRELPAADADEVRARLTEFDATFAEREARAAALEASAGAPIDAGLERLEQLQRQGRLLALADESRTTLEHRAMERETVAVAGRLAGARVAGIPPEIVERETLGTEEQLVAGGSHLSSEQRQAIKIACSDRQLAMIEGQAGTGKSTTLGAVGRAHRTAGRDLVVTSTGGLAAERLAGELEAAGAPARAYSLAALETALANGALELTEASTIIHDEAALASTREQHGLLRAVEESGARLIEVGDPRQSQPVGAGGLWPRIEGAVGQQRGRVELTRNVRARDPADEAAQSLFRRQQTDEALRDYAARGRVRIAEDPRVVEDAALDAAHADRTAGKQTLVIVQTTNERLDELNARAQAIRREGGELGRVGADLPGRPYRLYREDRVQVRRTTPHQELGALRNGTTGRVAEVAAGGDGLTLALDGGREIRLERDQLDQADVRLAYVQHPFPAQGQTTDTAHVIVGEHASHGGSYVALSRARERTDLYAAVSPADVGDGRDALGLVGERMGRSEAEAPSIDTPVAHEAGVLRQLERERESGLGFGSGEDVDGIEAGRSVGWEL